MGGYGRDRSVKVGHEINLTHAASYFWTVNQRPRLRLAEGDLRHPIDARNWNRPVQKSVDNWSSNWSRVNADPVKIWTWLTVLYELGLGIVGIVCAFSHLPLYLLKTAKKIVQVAQLSQRDRATP